MNQCISQSPCTLHFNYYFLCCAPFPCPLAPSHSPCPSPSWTVFCMLWPQFKNCSTNGKTNTRRATKKATDESQAKFLTGERNVINSSPPPPCPFSTLAMHYKYCITIICLTSCKLRIGFHVNAKSLSPLHMSLSLDVGCGSSFSLSIHLFFYSLHFYFCW